MDANPTALAKDVVGLCSAGCHQVIPQFFRRRNIYKIVAGQMTDFSSARSIFCASNAVRLCGDPEQDCREVCILLLAPETDIPSPPNQPSY